MRCRPVGHGTACANCLSSLFIKSQPPPAAGAPDPKAAYAVLCTPSRAFQLRQVQTSNSLFVTQPALAAQGNRPAVPTTCAIASCAATLELHPADGSAAPYLEQSLSVYHVVYGEVDAVENGKTKDDLFSDIPLSAQQCQSAWDDLLAFELSGSSYRPSASTTALVWQSANAAALAEAIKLDSQFLVDDVAKLVEDEGHPAALARAILNHLASWHQDSGDAWSSLDRRKTVVFVGTKLLEAKRGTADYLTADFLETWKDSLPEAWRGDADLTAIEAVYELPSSTTIRAKVAGAATSSTAATTPKAASSSRKWHEKFAKGRKK